MRRRGAIACAVGMCLLAGLEQPHGPVRNVSILSGVEPEPPPISAAVDETPTTNAGGCAGGCVWDPHAPPPLTEDELREAITAYALKGTTGDHLALDTLVFYATQTIGWFAARDADQLASVMNPSRLSFLREQLARTHAQIELRVVDRSGRSRMHLAPTRVPLEQKQHLAVHDRGGFPPLEVSGTVKRVGLDHLWTRL